MSEEATVIRKPLELNPATCPTGIRTARASKSVVKHVANPTYLISTVRALLSSQTARIDPPRSK